MKIEDFKNYLSEKYKEGVCRSFFKGKKEPKLVLKNNTLPYYISNQDPEISKIVYKFCKDKNISNLIYVAEIISKVFNKELDWFLGFLLIKNIPPNIIYNGCLLYFLFKNII